jgi:PPOX class probable F420-dependent enzyme
MGMSRRDAIRMTDDEVASFLAEQRVVTCATVGPDGRPHLMPLWFVPEDGAVLGWTYAASQKAKNLRRDPRATLQIESGDSYEELRGVMFEADTELIAEPEEVAAIGLRLALRYAPGEPAPEEAPPELRLRRCPGAQAGGDALPPDPHGQLGPPQARRDVLTFRGLPRFSRCRRRRGRGGRTRR